MQFDAISNCWLLHIVFITQLHQGNDVFMFSDLYWWFGRLAGTLFILIFLLYCSVFDYYWNLDSCDSLCGTIVNNNITDAISWSLEVLAQ